MTKRPAQIAVAFARHSLSLAALLALLVLASACPNKKPKKRKKAASAEQTAKVTLTTSPSNAAVFFQGRRRLGRTPLTLERKVGQSVVLLFVKKGRRRTRRTVHFEQANTVQRVHVRLAPAPGQLVISTGPLRGVRVRIDGKDRGRSPMRINLQRGVEHHLELNKPGHHPYSERFTLHDSKKPMKLDISLPPRALLKFPVGWLSIASDVPALVYVDGKLLGSVPLDRRPMRAGKHRLRLKSSAISSQKKVTVTVVAGKLKRMSIALRPPDAGASKGGKK